MAAAAAASAATPCIVVGHPSDARGAEGGKGGKGDEGEGDGLEAKLRAAVQRSGAVADGAVGPLAAAVAQLRAEEDEGIFVVEADAGDGAGAAVARIAVLLLPAGMMIPLKGVMPPPTPPTTLAPLKVVAATAAALPEEVDVMCGELRGVLSLRNAASGRYDVRMPDGRVLNPTQFEAAGGQGRQKKWRKNIRIVSTGERAETWLKGFGDAAA